jgi:hypothetical protein
VRQPFDDVKREAASVLQMAEGFLVGAAAIDAAVEMLCSSRRRAPAARSKRMTTWRQVVTHDATKLMPNSSPAPLTLSQPKLQCRA